MRSGTSGDELLRKVLAFEDDPVEGEVCLAGGGSALLGTASVRGSGGAGMPSLSSSLRSSMRDLKADVSVVDSMTRDVEATVEGSDLGGRGAGSTNSLVS